MNTAPTVVGYMVQETTSGIKQLCGMPFQNTTGDNIDIQSITAKNGEIDPDDGSFGLYWYDTTAQKYVYARYRPYGCADDGHPVPDDGLIGTPYTDKWYWVTDDDYFVILAPLGWKHDPDADPTIVDHGKTFAPGEGFWVLSSDAKPKLTVAGQVVVLPPTEATGSVGLNSGIKQLVTNPFPIGNYDIQTLVGKNGEIDPDDGSFGLYWYDTTAQKYVYARYRPYGCADDGHPVPDDGLIGTPYTDKWYWVTDDDYFVILAPLGWKHDPDADPTIVDHGKTFKSGEAFWVLSSDANPYLHFPNPFAK